MGERNEQPGSSSTPPSQAAAQQTFETRSRAVCCSGTSARPCSGCLLAPLSRHLTSQEPSCTPLSKPLMPPGLRDRAPALLPLALIAAAAAAACPQAVCGQALSLFAIVYLDGVPAALGLLLGILITGGGAERLVSQLPHCPCLPTFLPPAAKSSQTCISASASCHRHIPLFPCSCPQRMRAWESAAVCSGTLTSWRGTLWRACSASASCSRTSLR